MIFLDPKTDNFHPVRGNKALSIAFTADFLRGINKSNQQEEFSNYLENNSLGLCSSFHYSLNSKKIALQKILGDFSFGYLEALSFKYYLEKSFSNTDIDHFWCPEGISSPEAFEEVLKAYNFPSEKIIVLLIAENGIKAVKNSKFTEWREVLFKQERARFNNGKIYEFNKNGEMIHEINLVENRAQNLDSDIYKLKLSDRWILVLSRFFEYKNFLAEMNFHFDSGETEELCLGAYAKKIFQEKYDSDWENLPELKLTTEGGSWTSIVTESNSSGRHLGINNMYDVLKHKWHQHKDVAIPWNYLGFDLINQANAHLIEEDSCFILSLSPERFSSIHERPLFLEVPQNWKKVSNELFLYFTKILYQEFSQIATKRYQLSIKEQLETISKYLAHVSTFKPDSEEYKNALSPMKIPLEIHEFLVQIANLHKASAAFCDFHSSKTHPRAMFRLQHLAMIHKALKKLCPDKIEKFEKEINNILARDIKSEFTILADLYYSELNKIKALQVR
jgi:hypothetical protein